MRPGGESKARPASAPRRTKWLVFTGTRAQLWRFGASRHSEVLGTEAMRAGQGLVSLCAHLTLILWAGEKDVPQEAFAMCGLLYQTTRMVR